MAQPLQTRNTGLVDNIVKKNTDHQDGETSQPPNLQPDAKEEKELHSTHSFEWCQSGKRTGSITCDKAQTVEDMLKTNSEFRRIAKKNKTKELVIVRDGKAVSSHFPCSLIKNVRLILKYVKAANKPKQPCSGSGHPCRKRPAGELVMFHVLTTGGKDVVKIMRNPALKKTVQEITIYAYQGEKVKQALKRDGRFLKTIFTKNCALSHTSTEVNTEMSNLVDDLDGKTYKIIMLNRSNPTESQSSGLDDDYITQSESQRSESDENQNPSQQSATTEAVNDNSSEKKPKLNQSILREIPDSKQMRIHLSSEIKHLMTGMKSKVPRFSRIQNLFRVEYGKSAETCREVKTMKRLMELSSSVCQVRFNGGAVGSGFLLVDKFVLTNAHVVKEFCNLETTEQLGGRVTAHFSYEDLQQVGGEVEVEEVVGFEYGEDASGHQYDWALLKLSADKKLPHCLLPEFGFCSQGGAICIIGHPDGGVKKIDPCLIVPSPDRSNVVGRHYYENQEHVQLITQKFFERVSDSVNRQPQVLTYESCFYFGSSGSPVFDKHCKVVAMHSGGYHYSGPTGKTHSVIEYGYPLSHIIEHILVQMVERERVDMLKAYIDCPHPHHDIMTNLKKLVEGRNITAFRNALNSSVVKNDQSLKMFFDFFSQKEECVPMDIVT